MAKVKIIYGTAGGNTEVVCEKVAEVLTSAGHGVELLKAKVMKPENIGDFDLLILASPTYGYGLLEDYIEKFLDEFEASEVSLKDKKCSIIGLGDPKYDSDYHLEAIRVLNEFLKRQGASMLSIPLRVSGAPYALMDYVARWAEKIGELLTTEEK